MILTIGRIALGAAATFAGGIAVTGCGIFRRSEDTFPEPYNPTTKDGTIVASVDDNKTLYLKEDPKNPRQFLGRVVGPCHANGNVVLFRTAIERAVEIKCDIGSEFRITDPTVEVTVVDCEPGKEFEREVAGRCRGLRDTSEPR